MIVGEQAVVDAEITVGTAITLVASLRTRKKLSQASKALLRSLIRAAAAFKASLRVKPLKRCPPNVCRGKQYWAKYQWT